MPPWLINTDTVCKRYDLTKRQLFGVFHLHPPQGLCSFGMWCAVDPRFSDSMEASLSCGTGWFHVSNGNNRSLLAQHQRVSYRFSDKPTPGFTGPLAVNDYLKRGTLLFSREILAPESFVVDKQGMLSII